MVNEETSSIQSMKFNEYMTLKKVVVREEISIFINNSVEYLN
jgi:hypothetical protein